MGQDGRDRLSLASQSVAQSGEQLCLPRRGLRVGQCQLQHGDSFAGLRVPAGEPGTVVEPVGRTPVGQKPGVSEQFVEQSCLESQHGAHHRESQVRIAGCLPCERCEVSLAARGVEMTEAEGELVADSRVGVLSQPGDGRLKFLAVESVFGEHDRVFSNPWRLIGEADEEDGVLECSESVENPQRVGSGECQFRVSGGFDQCGDRFSVGSFDEQPLSGHSCPAVARFERFDQFTAGGRGELGWLQPFPVGRHQAVDPAAVVAAFQAKMFLDVFGDRVRMFDGFAVHVEHIERAVGSVDEVDGSEPVVVAMHEVASDVADKRISSKGIGVGIAGVDGDAGGGSEEADGELFGPRQSGLGLGIGHSAASSDDSPRLGLAFAIDRCGGSSGGNRANWGWRSEAGVSRQVAPRQQDVLDVIAVATDEAVAPGIEAVAELDSTGQRLDVERPGIEAEILAAECEDGFVVMCQLSGISSGGQRDAVVEAPLEVVGDALDVVAAEAGEDDLVQVGPAVVVCVFEVMECGWGEHEDSAVVAADGGRPADALSECHAAIERAVAVGVFESFHDSGIGLAAALGVQSRGFLREGVAVHLGDIEAAMGIEAGIDRVGDQWFAGDQFELKAVLQAEGGDGPFGFGRGNSGQFTGQRPGAVRRLDRFGGCRDEGGGPQQQGYLQSDVEGKAWDDHEVHQCS